MYDVNDILTHPGIQEAIATAAKNTDRSQGPDSCWPWRGKTQKGYGVLSVVQHGRAQVAYAHRLAYVLNKGALPDSFSGRKTWVLHTCDNPPCCNPAHLFLGNSKTNTADKVAKDRHSKGAEIGSAKLTQDIVVAILASGERGTVLAQRYGVSKSTVSNLRVRKTWKHLVTDVVPAPALTGLDNPMAKLSVEQVSAIIADTRTHRKIAPDYGISRQHVGAIKRRFRERA